MNSWSALVTAAFLVRSPLTSRARSSKFGSIDRFVAMCGPPHIMLHISDWPFNHTPVVSGRDWAYLLRGAGRGGAMEPERGDEGVGFGVGHVEPADEAGEPIAAAGGLGGNPLQRGPHRTPGFEGQHVWL